MKLKVNLFDKLTGTNETFDYNCDKDITINDFFLDIYNRFLKSYYKDNIKNFTPYFEFKKENKFQMARSEYKLIKFLKNFNYDYNNIDIVFIYGRGGGFDFERIGQIFINAGEPHSSAHIHIKSLSKKFVRLNLNTFTQMKGDSIKFEDLFSLQERKKILNFLKENDKKLIDYYERCNKGEYITDTYILYYNGKEYAIIEHMEIMNLKDD